MKTPQPLLTEPAQVVVFTLDAQRHALDLSVVERVIRAVKTVPLSKAPDVVLGVINMQGRVLPVLNIRRLLRLPEKEIEPGDHFIIADRSGFKVALWTDEIIGVADIKEEDIFSSENIFPGIEHMGGVAKLRDGMVFIYSLSSFLASAQESAPDCPVSESDLACQSGTEDVGGAS